MNFIFTCLPESHAALSNWVSNLERVGEIKTLETSQWHKRSKETCRSSYGNQSLLRDTQPALLVNWCERTLTRESDGKVLYHKDLTTHHLVVQKT